MAQFVQVEDRAYNADHIVSIRFYDVAGSNRIEIKLSDDNEGTSTYTLTGTRADGFMHWWNDRADVYRAV